MSRRGHVLTASNDMRGKGRLPKAEAKKLSVLRKKRRRLRKDEAKLVVQIAEAETTLKECGRAILDRAPVTTRDGVAAYRETTIKNGWGEQEDVERIVGYLEEHPLTREYEAYSGPLLPQYVLGDRFSALAGIARGWQRDGGPGAVTTAKQVVTLLSEAFVSVPFFVNSDTVECCFGLEVPPFVPDPLILPFPLMWLSLQCGRGLHSVLLAENPNGIWFVFFAGDGSSRYASWSQTLVPFGKEWHASGSADRFVFALLSLINSPHIVKVEHSLPRAMRRRLERDAPADAKPRLDTQVHEVVIRSANKHAAVDGEPEKTDHDFRWMVRGHIRNQWYPSKQYHKQIFVPAYVKGPEGKPLRPNVYRNAKL